MYDDGNEISATLSGTSGAGYKVDVGDTYKAVKFTAKATPIESIREYVLSSTSGNRTKTVNLNVLVIPEGVYKQDEFLPILDLYDFPIPESIGSIKILFINGSNLSAANFDRIVLMPPNAP